MTTPDLSRLETPCLLLEHERLQRNATAMLEKAARHGLYLRPHVKTSKCVEVAEIATGGRVSGLTASTLNEVDFFSRAGFTDILYAVGISENKFPRIAELVGKLHADLTLMTDNLGVARAAADFAREQELRLRFVIEIDCGEHRGGLPAESNEVVALASFLHRAANIEFAGVLTHGGHSYKYDRIEQIKQVAAEEVAAARTAADRIRDAGIPVDIVSVGSTPTVLLGENFDGVTEVRPGVYLFMDLSQYSRNVCEHGDIAVSVLATVIGHNRAGRSLTIDAGALALSKDLSANQFMPEAGYGQLCDVATGTPIGGLCVSDVHQEHGTVALPAASWFKRLPVGRQVRVMVNHICMTAAAYQHYQVIEPGKRMNIWRRNNGW